MHRHKCPECGIIWEHESTCAGSEEAHTCPVKGCGTINYNHYLGDDGVTFMNSCLPQNKRGEELVDTFILLPLDNTKI